MSHAAWAAIADALTPPDTPHPAVLGQVRLLPHQQEAVAMLAAQLDTHGIALLADDTGLGKTYVACALAREARRPLVVAPAAVRDVWRNASAATGVPFTLVSHEALSGGRAPAAPDADFVIIDEAHHARNPRTRRWQRLAALCRSARVLLVSATPMHNARHELTALFALTLGHAAADVSRSPHRYAVRRQRHDVRGAAPLPDVAPWTWHAAPETDGVAEALKALPPAMPPIDGREAAPLWRLGLVRAWASSDAALVAALRRRLARGLALEQALHEGRPLTRDALAAWTRDDMVQPTLALDVPTAEPHVTALLPIVTAHVDAVGALLRQLPTRTTDAARAAIIAATLDAQPGARAVLFTTYAATAECYWQRLRHRPGTALATGRGGRIASGATPRADLLRALEAPRASRVHPREQVRLLIATDVASEGLSLTAASILWHADLPWTPARLAQRTGRLARLGAPHSRIHVHAFAPPASTASPLPIRTRLATKAGLTRDLSAADAALTGIASPTEPSPLDALGLLRDFARHRAAMSEPGTTPARSAYPVALVSARAKGSIAVLGQAPEVMVWTFGAGGERDGHQPDASPNAAWALLRDTVPITSPRPRWPPEEQRLVRHAHAQLARARRALTVASDTLGRRNTHPSATSAATDATITRLLRRLGEALRHAPPADRASASATASELRRRLAHPVAAGWGAALAALADRPLDARWWPDATALATRLRAPPPDAALPPVRALIILVPRAESY